jgi:VWFA-related protein
MRTSRRGLGGVIVQVGALVAAVAAGWPAWATQQFRTGVDLVRLPVVVTAKDGLMARNLKATDFEIFEDGVKQTIAAFAEGATGEAVPLHLGLLLDVSGSMQTDLKDAANAAVQFVTALDEAVDVTLLDFDSAIRIGRFSRDSYPRLFERIRARKADGATALYDAIGIYLEGANARGGQHVLLMYTDGGDSSSKLNLPKVVDMLRFSNVIVYAMGYLENMTSTMRGMQQLQLTMLARETGGDAFFPASPRDLTAVYARILDEIGSRYTIGYESTNPKADGRFRKVEVKLLAPHNKAGKVRTRSGYLAPVKR